MGGPLSSLINVTREMSSRVEGAGLLGLPPSLSDPQISYMRPPSAGGFSRARCISVYIWSSTG
jgi:hypothetical protein